MKNKVLLLVISTESKLTTFFAQGGEDNKMQFKFIDFFYKFSYAESVFS